MMWACPSGKKGRLPACFAACGIIDVYEHLIAERDEDQYREEMNGTEKTALARTARAVGWSAPTLGSQRSGSGSMLDPSTSKRNTSLTACSRFTWQNARTSGSSMASGNARMFT